MRRHRIGDFDVPATRRLGANFGHDNCIGALGNRRARHDSNRLILAHTTPKGISGQCGANQFERNRRVLRGAEALFSPQRVTVHRRARKARDIDPGTHVFGKHPPRALEQANLLCAQCPDVFREKGVDFGHVGAFSKAPHTNIAHHQAVAAQIQ